MKTTVIDYEFYSMLQYYKVYGTQRNSNLGLGSPLRPVSPLPIILY